MEKENIIMQYISIWNWHIIAVLFLIGALIVITIRVNLTTGIVFFIFLSAFGISEFFSYTRRKKLLEDKNNNE